MDSQSIVRAAALLTEARAGKRPIEGLTGALRPDDAAAAYAIQDAAIPAILEAAGGGRVVGRKIGCTNKQAQAMLGLEEPFHGQLLSPFVFESPASVPAGGFFMRVLEPEFAFRLGRDLPADGAPYEAADVKAAIAAVMPAIEIVDSRYVDWTKVGGLHLIADNGSNGAWVQGPETDDLSDIDFAGHPVAFSLNDEVRERGSSANVLGSPLNALTWLANDLARHGKALRAGDMVSTGTCTQVIMAGPGDRAVADFGALGQVSVSFI